MEGSAGDLRKSRANNIPLVLALHGRTGGPMQLGRTTEFRGLWDFSARRIFWRSASGNRRFETTLGPKDWRSLSQNASNSLMAMGA